MKLSKLKSQPKIKVLFTDLDRTLLSHDYRIHPKVLRAFASARQLGLRIVIVTARAPKSLLPYSDALENNGLAACYNGAWIGRMDSGEVLNTVRLKKELAIEIMDDATKAGSEPIWYDEGLIGVRRLTDDVVKQLAGVGEKAELMSARPHLWSAPYKIMCVDRRENTGFDTIKNSWSSQTNIAQSHKVLLEIGPTTASKGMAIGLICKYLGMSLSECAAAGDSYNDIPMLKAAAHTYTVGNGVEEVKQVASFIGGNCDDGGLADVIDSILALNQKY